MEDRARGPAKKKGAGRVDPLPVKYRPVDFVTCGAHRRLGVVRSVREARWRATLRRRGKQLSAEARCCVAPTRARRLAGEQCSGASPESCEPSRLHGVCYRREATSLLRAVPLPGGRPNRRGLKRRPGEPTRPSTGSHDLPMPVARDWCLRLAGGAFAPRSPACDVPEPQRARRGSAALLGLPYRRCS